MLKKLSPSVLLLATILSAAFLAELFRVNGYLLLDLLGPPLVSMWFFTKFIQKKPIRWTKTVWASLFFLWIGAVSLLLHSAALEQSAFLSGLFYLIRFASLFALSIISFNLTETEARTAEWLVFTFVVLLAMAGFVQLLIKPDFTDLEQLGWDPHQGRLLSTWFDPNFVGGCLAFFTPVFLGTALEDKHNQQDRWILLLGVGILLVAIALTLSRSTYLALLIGLMVFGFLRSFKSVALGAAVLILLSMLITPIQDRVTSLVNSFESVVSNSYTLPDSSARLRYDSWRVGWTLFLDSPWIGQGYNNYKEAALEKGLIKDPNVHASSGSDSSFLTILATTGILGFLPFLSLYILLLASGWEKRHTSIGAAYLGGLCGLLIHSIFVNSLLFPLFMAPFWISIGLFQKFAASTKSHGFDQ